MEGESKVSEALSVRFIAAEAGWLDFAVLPLTGEAPVTATHLTDPFPEMLKWLEAILGGAEAARWVVDEEGSTAQFVFTAEAHGILGHTRPALTLLRSGYNPPEPRLASIAVEPRDLVRGFYEAFRGFAEGAAYRPEQWESGFVYEDGEETTWDAAPLRALRSPAIEAALAGP